MQKLLLTVLLCSVAGLVFPRTFIDLLHVEQDSNYIESHFNDLILRVYTGEKNHFLKFRDIDNQYSLEYNPNLSYNLGVGFNYRFFGFNLGFHVPFLLDEEKNFGKTKHFGLQSYIYTKRLAIDLLTSFSSGYYLKNSEFHIEGWNSDNVEYQRSDISAENIGLNINYIFNSERFSYKAAFIQTEKQKKSAGSFIAGAGVFSFKTKADSSLIPQGLNTELFTGVNDIKTAGVLAANANFGYAYSFVLKNWLLSLSYVLSAGIQENSFNFIEQNQHNRFRLSSRTNSRFSLGYHFNDYYMGISMIRSEQFTNLKANGLSIHNGTQFIRLTISKQIHF